jgi:hypothetical protein
VWLLRNLVEIMQQLCMKAGSSMDAFRAAVQRSPVLEPCLSQVPEMWLDAMFSAPAHKVCELGGLFKHGLDTCNTTFAACIQLACRFAPLHKSSLLQKNCSLLYLPV